MRGWWFGGGGLPFGPHPCLHSFFLLPKKPTTNSIFLVVHSPAHAGSLAATFTGNSTFQMVRSDAMQAVVPGKTPRMGLCLCSRTIISFGRHAGRAILPSRRGSSAGSTQHLPAGVGEMRTLGRALQLRINWVCSM